VRLEPGTLAIAKPSTGNSKLGEAAATYAAQQSCPSGCVFIDGGGCYAETGRLGKFVTSPLNAAARGAGPVEVARAEAEAIDSLAVPVGRPLRLHVVGDCPDDECANIVARAAERYVERGGGPVWTYTHAWREVDRKSWGKVSVLASCETPMDVWLAAQRGYATALVVEEFPTHRRHARLMPGQQLTEFATGDDVKVDVLPCPSQTKDRSCTDCRLCLDDTKLRQRGYSIGFALHGIPVAKQRARLALSNPSDPDRRRSLEDRLRDLLDRTPEISAGDAARRLDANAAYTAQLLAYLRGEAKHPSVLRRERYDRKKVTV
jgi:hypothetical protein